MRNFYPFFLECSKRETDAFRRKQFELLAFGKGGVIIGDGEGNPVYVTERGHFQIPKSYSDEEKNKLVKLVWNEDTDFVRMEKDIKDSVKTWTNVKKRDKLRIIDKYVLQLECDLKEKKMIKSVITIALILRLLETNDIVYKDFEIKTITGNFNVDYFTRLAKSVSGNAIRSVSLTPCKISAKDIWRRVYCSKVKHSKLS